MQMSIYHQHNLMAADNKFLKNSMSLGGLLYLTYQGKFFFLTFSSNQT